MQILSYDVMGTKEAFADWISDITPLDTPFVSLTGKAPVHNKLFEWQYDRLEHAGENAHSAAVIPDPILKPTTPVSNITQILRKVVQVSHTADALDNYGKGKESEYQIEKASKEIKRDLEKILLSRQKKNDTGQIRKTACFFELVAPLNEADPETGAITHKALTTSTFTEEDIWDLDKELYMAGSRANIIMVHPTLIDQFGEWTEKSVSRAATRIEKWDGAEDHEVNNLVTSIISPLGREYTLLPNSKMDKRLVYFFHPHDWFQRILRAPDLNHLDSDGSYEKWMIEMEIGLQHRNPWASGILELALKPVPIIVPPAPTAPPVISKQPVDVSTPEGSTVDISVEAHNPGGTDTTGITYQWQYAFPNMAISYTNVSPVDVENGSDKKATLHFKVGTGAGNTLLKSGVTFKCLVTNVAGTVESNEVNLTIT